MKLHEKIKKNYDYLFPALIWIFIFGKNLFSQMMFVDNVPDTYFNSLKFLALGNYTTVLTPIDLVKLIFTPLHLLPYLFQLTILISMFISYFFIKKLFNDKEKVFQILFSLIFFFNPFVYSRIMIGQLGAIIAYLLLPVTTYYIFQLINSKLAFKQILKTSLAITICSLTSIHFIIINLILLITTLIFYIKDLKIKKIFLSLIYITILLILLNSFWFQGMYSSRILQTIDSSHEDFFSPKLSSNIPAVAKIIGMYGFWRESGYNTLYTQLGAITYYILLFLMITLLITGYYISNDKKSKIFYTLFWIGLVLGTGISHPYTRPIFNYLFTYLPFFNGFRDSHKLVSLIALAYAYFLPITIIKISPKLKKIKFLPIILLVLLIFAFTFPLINLGNQIKPITYPNDYKELNQFLKTKQIQGKIIYLPWQTYLTYNWTLGSSSDGRIAIPINQILKYPIITGPDTYSSQTLETSRITKCLSENSIKCLENNSIQFIIKDKCSLYYEPSITQNLSNIYNNSCLELYELHPTLSQKSAIPIRFIIGSIISILTLIIILIFLKNNKSYFLD